MFVKSRHEVYAYRGKFYVPCLARTDAGFYWELEPIAVIEPIAEQLRAVLETALKNGNPTVATPSREDYPSLPYVVRRAGARTSKAFEREARLWAVESSDNQITLEAMKRHPEGGWVQPQDVQAFPITSEGIDALVSAILREAN